MNYIKIIVAFLISGIFLLSSCRDDHSWIKGEGPNVTNTRRVASFTGVSLSMEAEVRLVRDSSYSIELRGQQNILDVIETRVSGNTLSIYVDYRSHIRRHNPITIIVHVPTLERVDISGSGDIHCMDDFNAYNLNANVSGSGDIRLSGNVSNYFSATVSGSGSIYHNGSGVCESAKFRISGSGDINAEWLQTETLDASISGSGDQRVYVLDKLNADISGSGSIAYRGNPIIDKHISGSGKVISIQ